MKLGRSVITSMLVAGLVAGWAGTAEAATPASQPAGLVYLGEYAIWSVGPDLTPETSDRVVDVENWSLADRGRVHMWDFRTTGNVDNQRWMFDENDDGYLEIINLNSGLCLDKSEDNGNVDGALVYQYSCSGATNQQWYFDGNGAGGHSRLRSRADGRCLDIRDKVDADDATVQVWGCNSVGWNQSWYLTAE